MSAHAYTEDQESEGFTLTLTSPKLRTLTLTSPSGRGVRRGGCRAPCHHRPTDFRKLAGFT
jgi:hypothetical protein